MPMVVTGHESAATRAVRGSVRSLLLQPMDGRTRANTRAAIDTACHPMAARCRRTSTSASRDGDLEGSLQLHTVAQRPRTTSARLTVTRSERRVRGGEPARSPGGRRLRGHRRGVRTVIDALDHRYLKRSRARQPHERAPRHMDLDASRARAAGPVTRVVRETCTPAASTAAPDVS